LVTFVKASLKNLLRGNSHDLELDIDQLFTTFLFSCKSISVLKRRKNGFTLVFDQASDLQSFHSSFFKKGLIV